MPRKPFDWTIGTRLLRLKLLLSARTYNQKEIAEKIGDGCTHWNVMHMAGVIRGYRKPALPKEQRTYWLDNRVAELIGLRNRGRDTSRIAVLLTEKFGIEISRCAVISKLRRLEEPNATVERPKREGQQTALRLLKRVPLKSAFKPVSAEIPDHCVNLENLFENDCRYIYGDPQGDHAWCGKKKVPGKSYCATHLALCYQAPQPRRPRGPVIERPKTFYELEDA